MNVISGTWWPSASLVVGLAWKSTALLVAVLIVVRASLRGGRAAVASAVANAGLVGLLLLPLSSLALPPLAVRCLPADDGDTDAAKGTPAPAAPMPLRSVDRADLEQPVPATHASDAGQFGGDAPGPIEVDRARPAFPVALRPSAPAVRRADWRAISATAAAGAYALGVAFLLVRLAGGLALVAWLRRGAVAVDDPGWCAAFRHWRARLGIGEGVDLAWSSGVSVPVVVGWRRPTVLLPASAAALEPAGHADAVLLHELAHVRRGDYAWNLLHRVVVAAYWVHPLAWLLARSAAAARERACDDLCVHEAGGPEAYRATLLAVASGIVRRPGPALGLAMARSPRLARRLAGIDASRGASRCLPRWPARLVITALGLAVAGSVGATQLTRAEGRPAADAPPKPEAGKVFHLRVVADDGGKPVPNAQVRIWIALRSEWRTADDQGQLAITHSTGPADRTLGVDAWGDGFAMQRHHWGQKPGEPIPGEATIRLRPGETLGGLVRDDQGRPIDGANVYLWSHNYKKNDPHELLFDLRSVTGPDGRWKTSGAPATTGELLGFHVDHPDYLSDRDYTTGREKPTIADLRAGKAVAVMTKGVPIEGRVLDVDGKPVAGATVLSADSEGDLGSELDEFAVTTDEAGHFRTGQVRSKLWYLIAKAGGHAPGERTVEVGKAVPQVEIRLGRPRAFTGRVVDPDGKPIAGAFVNVDTWRRYRFLGVFLYTDRDGRFRWDDAPDDTLRINVSADGHIHIDQQDVKPTADGVVFTLKPSLAIHGKVLDAETGERVKTAALEYAAVDPKTGDVAGWTGMPPFGTGVQVYQGSLSMNFPVAADAYKIRIVAEGYEPFVSRAFRRAEVAVFDYDVKLAPARPGTGPVATALKPDGQPLAGARVYRSVRNESSLSIRDDAVQTERESGREVRTGPDGTFPVPTTTKPWLVLILGDDSYGYASKDAIAASPRVKTQPYARVEGRYRIGGRPGARLPLELSGLRQDSSTLLNTIFFRRTTTTDDQGRFVFERVIPMIDLHVARREDGKGAVRPWSLGVPVHVEPGATARVDLGGTGRPVAGRVEPPRGWTEPINFTDGPTAAIESNRTWTPYPLSLFRGKTSLDSRAWVDWSERWRESPEGRDYRDRRVAASVGLAPDGSFRFDDVPPGEFRLTLEVPGRRASREPGPFARLVQVFTIPPVAGGRSDTPLDLGVLRLEPRGELKRGDPAPAFEVTTVDGRKLAVPGDFAGKVLLLDIGTHWEQQSAFQITRLNDVVKRFGADPRFAILSVTLEADTAATRTYIAEKGEPWPQAIVGPLANPIASAYGVQDHDMPAAVLIGPDGKVIDALLRYQAIGTAVGEALGRK